MSPTYETVVNPNLESTVKLLALACTELKEIHRHMETVVAQLEELIKAQPGHK